ncbi:MAG: transcriptional regulator, partial [Bdellovibrionales bacterium RIFOXYD1_FULL_53_11]
MGIQELIHKPESKTLEFKRDISSPEKIIRTIVAFANTAGGTILIGIEDGSKKIIGIPDPLEQEERLANLISDCISPAMIPDIEILPWHDTNLIAIKVYPGAARPHFIKSMGLDNGTYIRVGSTNRKADKTFIEDCRLLSRNEAYDEQPMPHLGMDEIDTQYLNECFSDLWHIGSKELRNLRITTTHQGREVPTTGGVLLFGKNRNHHFPDARIQMARFAGSDKSQIAEMNEFNEYPVKAIESAIAFIKRLSSEGVKIGEVRRKVLHAFPPAATREAVINSVVHADYSQRGSPIRIAIFDDRMEIENPGLLPSGLSIEDILAGLSKLRNRVIGRVFNELGLIEQWGSGIQRILSAFEAAGVMAPKFEETGTHFRVTFYRKKISHPKIDSKNQKILD